MGTALGTGAGNKIIMNGRNDHASITIAKGEICALDVTVIVTADGMNNDPVFSIGPNTTADDADGAGGVACGVALDDIAPGEFGPFCIFGLVKAKLSSVQAVGDVLGVDPTNPEDLEDAASATFQAPCGILLEASVAGGLAWCFVDFISGSFGGDVTTGVAGDSPISFWGQAY